MTTLRHLLRRRRATGERGAIAVEAAVLIGFVLIPLMLGVISYGSYFWQAQRVSPLASRLPLDGIVGQFTCAELVDRVKTTVQSALPQIDGLTGPLPLSSIGVQVVDVLPTIGVDIKVSISVPLTGSLSLFPLPGGGNLLSDASYRLDNVQVSTTSC